FIAMSIAGYFTQYHFKAQGEPIMQTIPIGRQDVPAGMEALKGINAHIPRLGSFVPGFPERIPLNIAFILALLACVLVYIFLWRTKWGYAIRATGANPTAAEYGGISVKKQIVLAMAVSGGLAGMVAINEVLGYRYRYYEGFSSGIGYGFTGIAVALLGRNHPIGVVFSALLFGALTRGSLFVDIFTDKVSKDLVQVLQGIIILFVAAEALFRGPLSKWGLLKRSKV